MTKYDPNLLPKILTIFLFTFIACLLAGVYGILHYQVTYTISPEYYTKFKFHQFGLLEKGMNSTTSNPRLWVCYVGFMATWWMGIPIGIILASISLDPEIRTTIDITLKGFLVVLTITLVTGLYGFYEGHFYLANQPKENLQGWFIPDDLVDFKSFITVGSMHNYSYLGGSYGLIGGVVYAGWRKGFFRALGRPET